MKPSLGPVEGRVYAALSGAGEVAISDLFKHVYPARTDITEARRMQQSLGPAIHRVNKKLRGSKVIKPGRTKQTYVME